MICSQIISILPAEVNAGGFAVVTESRVHFCQCCLNEQMKDSFQLTNIYWHVYRVLITTTDQGYKYC